MLKFLVIYAILDIIALLLLWLVEDKDYWDDLFMTFEQSFLKTTGDVIILLLLFPFTIPNSIHQLVKSKK